MGPCVYTYAHIRTATLVNSLPCAFSGQAYVLVEHFQPNEHLGLQVFTELSADSRILSGHRHGNPLLHNLHYDQSAHPRNCDHSTHHPTSLCPSSNDLSSATVSHLIRGYYFKYALKFRTNVTYHSCYLSKIV